MGTIYVKVSKSLPITFQQKEGDKRAATLAVHSAVDANSAKSNIALGLLQVFGHHWDSLAQVSPMLRPGARTEEAVAADERAWNKATGLPLVRELIRVAYGNDVGDIAEGEMAPYFTRLAQATFYGVSPFSANQERLLNWGEFVKAIAAKKGKEPNDKAIVRGVGTFIRKDAQGNIHVPSLDSAVSAGMDLGADVRRALAMLILEMIPTAELEAAKVELASFKQREQADAANIIKESAE